MSNSPPIFIDIPDTNRANVDQENDKRQKRRKKSSLLEAFQDFNSNTTLHGLKYLSERGLSVLEKMFWLVTILLSLVMCCILIHNVWNKWQTSPVIVSFSEEMVPVWQVPFPSVTICPQTKVNASIYNYTSSYLDVRKHLTGNKNMTRRLVEKLLNVYMVCRDEYHPHFVVREICNHTLVNDINQVSPDVDDIIYYCYWRRRPCNEFISRVITSRGVCFSFNILTASEIFHKDRIQNEYKYLDDTVHKSTGWSLENGYEVNFATEAYPLRGRDNGPVPYFYIIFQENVVNKDINCNGFHNGFEVYLHHPAELPRSSINYYSVIPERTTSLAVSFRMMTTSENLRNYDPHTRKCYFSSERPLRYFKKYTQGNCEAECKSNYTFAKCGCVGFHMPHNNSEELCCDSKQICVVIAIDELVDYEMQLLSAGNKTAVGCDCLPACDSLHYDAEALVSDYNFESSENDGYKLSRLRVYFKDTQFLSIRRSELFGATDFLANCGGLLGLFLGFSFLSLVEIAYFSSLRICCIIRRDRTRKKSSTNAPRKIYS